MTVYTQTRMRASFFFFFFVSFSGRLAAPESVGATQWCGGLTSALSNPTTKQRQLTTQKENNNNNIVL